MSDNDTGPGLVRQVISAVAARFDGWANIVTGQGTARDKRMYSEMSLDLLTEAQEENLYRGSAIHRRAVDLLPDECFRVGFEVRVPGDAGLAQAINTRLSELDVEAKYWEAYHFARLHGGALVLPGINNGDGPTDMPLDLGAIQSVDFVNVFSRHEAWALEYYAEPLRKWYGDVRSYQLSPMMGGWFNEWTQMHASRAITFDGVPVQRHTRQAQQGWGDGLYVALHEAIRDWGSSYAGAAHLVQDAGQGIFKMPELTQLILQGKQDAVRTKMQMFDLYRSNMRALLLGDKESFERVVTQFSGLDSVLMRLDFQLAAIIGFPVTVLLGQAPAGLNATGSADMELFRTGAQAVQRRYLRPRLERLVRLIFLSKKGPSKGVEPEDWSVVFRPLAQPTAKEAADVKKTHAETDQIRLSAGIITQSEARGRLAGDEYRDEVTLDTALDEPLPTDAAEQELEQERLAAEAAARAGQAPAPPGAVPTPADGAEKVADTALNGAQVKAAMDIILSVGKREMPRDSGIGLLMECFNLTLEAAERMMASTGRDFFVAPQETPPAPAAGAAPDGTEEDAAAGDGAGT